MAHYVIAFNKHILPYLGHVALAKLTKEMIEAWREQLKEKRIGMEAIKYSVKRLKACLAAAVEAKRLGENPAQAVKNVRTKKRQLTASSFSDYPRLQAAAGGHHLAAVIQLAVDSGLRCSEVCALRWEDIDWAGQRLWVKWHMVSCGSVKSGQHIDQLVPGSKTNPDTKPVHLSRRSLEVLQAHRERLRQLQGPGWKTGQATKFFEADHSGSREGKPYVVPTDPGADGALVFPSADGTPLMTQNMYGWFVRVCERAGLDKNFHQMRHDCGSFMLAKGVPLTVVSKHLRHANPAITAEIYSHLIAEQERLGADAMDSLWDELDAQAQAV